MKKLVSFILALSLMTCMVPSVSAASDEATEAAEVLYELGLFRGTGTNPDGTPIFDLDKTPTRNQAVIMLVRLLGKEEEALAGEWDLPFTDVPKNSTAYPYIGYAYANGLTSGTTATTYSGTNPIKANQYITFVLRALGYESGKDFQVGTSWKLADELGITAGAYSAANMSFTRGDVAKISLKAHEIQKVVATAPYWGLPADIRWVADPVNEDDHINNIHYLFLFGNYHLQNPYDKDLSGWIEENKLRSSTFKVGKDLTYAYPELMGAYCNMSWMPQRGTYADGTSIYFVMYEHSKVQPTLTAEEVYEQQLAALDEALKIKETLYKTGKIRDGMSQLQIAKAYESYLLGLNVKGGISKGDPSCVEYDSAYAALINRKADCVGKAAAFNLLMNVEGIPVQGVRGSFHGTTSGHVLSRVVLDGKEYFSDWGNRRQLGTEGQYEKTHGFWFDPESLEAARAVK